MEPADGVQRPTDVFPLRKEGRSKVTGQALYIDDIPFEHLLHGRTVRSSVPHGIVRGIRRGDGIPWDEVVVATARDIPGQNVVTLIEPDQPLLADGMVRHAAEPVALVAHPDREVAQKAARALEVLIDPLPAVFDVDEALARRVIVRPPDNVIKELVLLEGDPDTAWGGCDVIVEGTYETAAQDQLYIEPQGVVAIASPTEGVTVHGSLQCPYYVHKAMMPIFGLGPEKVRVVQSETGGAFGGKEEYPNVLSGHAALLSWKAGGRPVKIVYDRLEDLAATTKRHPSRTWIKAGFRRDGTLVALDIDIKLDGGAYVTLSPVVLSRAILHCFGPYRCPHTRARARAVATHCLPFGAFRGFGVPQAVFAIELHITKCAARLGLDPAELRRRNLIRRGDRLPTGQVIQEEIDLDLLMGKALEESGFVEKHRRYERENASRPQILKGIGLSMFFHGCGFTGDGEVMLASRLSARLDGEGQVEVLAANVEYGQGTNTVFGVIAAEALKIPYDWVRVHRPDTRAVPNSGPTVASRTTMVIGGLLERACHRIRATLVEGGFLGQPYSADDFRRAAAAHVARHGPLVVTVDYEPPPGVSWDALHYRGEPYSCYSWSCDVAEVEVDPVTAEVRLVDFVSAVECGRVLHPLLARGQIEGGVAQSVGFALYEDVSFRDGAMVNAQMTNYIIPTAADTPPLRVFFIEFPRSNPGPLGAKGIGELPADGPAPAVAAAVGQALGGQFIDRVPIFPEHVLARLAPR